MGVMEMKRWLHTPQSFRTKTSQPDTILCQTQNITFLWGGESILPLYSWCILSLAYRVENTIGKSIFNYVYF